MNQGFTNQWFSNYWFIDILTIINYNQPMILQQILIENGWLIIG